MKIKLRDITNQFVLPLWNKKALDVVDAFVDTNADIQTTFFSGQGPLALKEYVQQIFNAFSAFEFSIQGITKNENQVIYHWHGTAIHTGPVFNILPRRSRVLFSGILSIEILEGVIVRYHSFCNTPHAVNFPEMDPPKDLSIDFSFDAEIISSSIKSVTGKRLTKREIECLSLWLKGFAIKDTARALGGLSSRTIQSFRENIKRKLNVETYQQLFSTIQHSGVIAALLD